MFLSSKLNTLITEHSVCFTILYNCDEQFYSGNLIKLRPFKSNIKTSICKDLVKVYQDYNKNIQKLILKIKDIIIENNLDVDSNYLTFNLDKKDLSERLKIIKSNKPINPSNCKKNQFQNILFNLIEFNLTLINNQKTYDFLKKRFDNIKYYAKTKNGMITGLNYPIFLDFFDKLYFELIQIFKETKKELLRYPNEIHSIVNITTLYEHQRFFLNLFKRNDLGYEINKDLETYDFSLLERLNKFANLGELVILDKYFDEYLFNIISNRVLLLPKLINYSSNFEDLNIFYSFNLIELILINKNIVVFSKSKNISQNSIFGKGSSFWKENGAYLDIKEKLMNSI
jgi:hypothetical protein